jgi:hypothetical protein
LFSRSPGGIGVDREHDVVIAHERLPSEDEGGEIMIILLTRLLLVIPGG